jgi:hypothetical protein
VLIHMKGPVLKSEISVAEKINQESGEEKWE